MIRRLKLSFALYNFFNKRKLMHNVPLYKKLGLKKKYWSPVSSADFRNAEQANQTCPKFTNGQRDDLEYLAANDNAPGHSLARALLLQEAGEEFDTELHFPLNPRNFMVNKPKQAVASLMRIHPNPTNDLVYISFRMPQGDVKAEIELHDSSGRTALLLDVSQSNGLVELSMKTLGTGLYTITLRFDGRAIETGKLTVVK